MRKLVIVALVAALIWPITRAQARSARHLQLQPASAWVLDYAEESCRLAREFGEKDDRVTLMLSQFAPGDRFSVMLTGGVIRVSNPENLKRGKLRFGPNEAESNASAKLGKANKNIPALLLEGSYRLAPLTEQEKELAKAAVEAGRPFDFTPIGPAREAAATRLELTGMMSRGLILHTGPLDQAMAALRECSWDLVRSWGLDVAQQKTLSRKVRATKGPQNWFNPNDYPVSMLRDGYEGVVNVRLLIGADGKPTSCKIQASTNPKDFDDVVCKVVIRRGEFEPALDAQGSPVPSYWTQSVNFRLCC